RQGEPLRFGLEAETVHIFETRSYEALVAELERWIARCTVWTREGDQEPREGGACGERASSSRRAATAAPSTRIVGARAAARRLTPGLSARSSAADSDAAVGLGPSWAAPIPRAATRRAK